MKKDFSIGNIFIETFYILETPMYFKYNPKTASETRNQNHL